MTSGMDDMRMTMASKAQDGIIFNKEGRKYKLNQPFRTTQLIFPKSRGILDKNDISKVQRGDQEEIISEPIDKQVNSKFFYKIMMLITSFSAFRTNVLLGPKGRSINEVKANFNDPNNFESGVPPLFEATEVYEALEKQPFRTLSVIHPEPKNLPKIQKNLEEKVKYETPAASLFDYAPTY